MNMILDLYYLSLALSLCFLKIPYMLFRFSRRKCNIFKKYCFIWTRHALIISKKTIGAVVLLVVELSTRKLTTTVSFFETTSLDTVLYIQNL
jgi:hypothetical protein